MLNICLKSKKKIELHEHSGILERFILWNSQNFQIPVLGMMELWTNYQDYFKNNSFIVLYYKYFILAKK